MPDPTNQPGKPIPTVSIPGLGAVPVVAVKLPSGQVVLRHPDELQKQTPPKPQTGGAT